MKKIFGTGKLVMYDDPWVGMTLCVILADINTNERLLINIHIIAG